MSMDYISEYKDYTGYIAIMISTDKLIFDEKSPVHARMIEYAKLYKELHIVVFSTKNLQQQIASNCTIYSSNSILRWNYVKNVSNIGRKIIKKIDKEQPILVTCQDPFETALVGKYLANLRKNSELLIQIHTDIFSPYFASIRVGLKNYILNNIRLLISRCTLPHAQVIRVVSLKIADSLVEKGIPKEKIVVKPIAVNVDHIKDTQPTFNLREKFPQFKKIILAVGRLESEKNMSLAIEAFKKVGREDVGLVIVGTGRQTNMLKRKSKTLGVEKNVVFEGWQTDLISYYKGSDLFICTSYYEGYGMVFKEAQAAGLPIVSTDVGIAREVGAKIVGWNENEIAVAIKEAL